MEQNGKDLKALQAGEVIDVEPQQAASDTAKLRYAEAQRAKE